MILHDTYTLANGVAIPKLGLGTWMIPDGPVAAAVESAVELGYRHIDTAQAYQNEAVTAMAARYGVSVPQLSIRYDLQLGLLPLPKTANPAHMKTNAAVDFEITSEDMDVLKALPQIEHYGEASFMPVFGGKLP